MGPLALEWPLCVCVCVSGVWDNGGSGAGPESDCVWTCGAGDLYDNNGGEQLIVWRCF